MNPTDALAVADYRRTVAELYAMVRRTPSPRDAHRLWIESRDELFARHPQSAISSERRKAFPGLTYWPYDPSARTAGRLVSATPRSIEIGHSGEGSTRCDRIATVRFELRGRSLELDLYWLDAYGGGLFLPFKDTTNGTTTYGGGRYLLDTVKGADLGGSEGDLTLDFNFAYHPSCVHDDRWSCPLAPPDNRVDIAITAGERLDPP